MNPKHVQGSAEGIYIGGLTGKKLKQKYNPGSSPNKQKVDKTTGAPIVSPYASSQIFPTGKLPEIGHVDMPLSKTDPARAPSFILNEDMVKIRQAELVILKEEEKFGKYSKDPQGNLAPILLVIYLYNTII